METLDQKRQRAANAALLTLIQQQLPQNPFGEYLLALAETDLGATGEAEAMPALLPAPLLPPVPTPDAPVETAPEFLHSGVEAPEESTSGESAPTAQRRTRTPRQKAKTPPSSPSAPPAVPTAPAPVRKPKTAKAKPVPPTPVATPEDAPDFDGRAAAQRYVEECLKQSQGVNRTLVGQYLGTALFSEINKFVVATQDAYRERNHLRQNGEPRQSKGQAAQIEANFARLAQAIHGSDDDDEGDDEPSDAELRAMERAAQPKPVKTVTRRMSDEVFPFRDCPVCKQRIPRNGVEPPSIYAQRKTCSKVCAGKARAAKAAAAKEGKD